MTSKEHTSQIKESKNKENIINLGDSDSKKSEDTKHKNPSIKAMQMKEKKKYKI